jgi:glycosyltransferase involved in cell wall biosynthesis
VVVTVPTGERPPPKVSICMLAYNHEKYIGQAIDSVLMQKVSFPYEIVIGEDCSTDTTREIVLDYQRRYPERIRLLLPEHNMGMMANSRQVLHASRGEYVALLEGDDYWLTDSKLQTQVTFLDQHPEFSLHCHPVRLLHAEGGLSDDRVRHKRSIIRLPDLAAGNALIRTCSVMLRGELCRRLPAWFDHCRVGDLPLFLWAAHAGDIYHSRKRMSVYRLHESGVWSALSFARQMETTVAVLEQLSTDLNHRYRRCFQRNITDKKLMLAAQYYRTGNYDQWRSLSRECLFERFRYLNFADRKPYMALFRYTAPKLATRLRAALPLRRA